MKKINIFVIILVIAIVIYLIYNSKKEVFETRINLDNPDGLMVLQDFTKYGIKGNKGDLGLHFLEKSGRLWLGSWDSGLSGSSENGEVQLLLSGKHNQGANNGTNGRTTYKLKIEGYDNDGSIVYPIYCRDENNNVDFFVRNRQTPDGLPYCAMGGNLGVKNNIHIGKDLIVKKRIYAEGIDILKDLVPRGTIVIFYYKNRIPRGWAICDGKSGTPDLRGRFVLQESSDRKFGTKGGQYTVKLEDAHMPKHTHGCVENGGHVHDMNMTGGHRHDLNIGPGGNDDCMNWNDYRHDTGCGAPWDPKIHKNPKIQSEEGNHKHTLVENGKHKHTILYAGGSQNHENMPPYYVLVYIMKVVDF